MSNKELFKKIYNEKINKEKNYREILNHIESHNITNEMWKWAFIPTCLIIIFICILFNKDNNIKEIKYNNDIVINYLEKIQESTSDIIFNFEEKSIEELILKFNFIKNLNMKSQTSRLGVIYDIDYKELYGYNLMYSLDDNPNKTIDIFFSKTREKRIRCINYEFNLNELKNSNINNTLIKIVQMGDYYIGIFQYNDLYFDIETYNLTEKEFVELLESITK